MSDSVNAYSPAPGQFNANQYTNGNQPSGTSEQSQRPAQPPRENSGRDPGDHRSADVISSGPLFRGITPSQNGEASQLKGSDREAFYRQVGGDWNDPNASPDERADRAANAERVLRYIDNVGGENSEANNNNIDGWAPRSNTRDRSLNLSPLEIGTPNSESRMFLNFIRNGYSALL